MQIHEYIDKMKKIHQNILEYLEDGSKEEEYQNLLTLIDENHIRDLYSELKNFLHLIVSISNDHYRTSDFFGKIEQLILQFKDEISKNFTNLQIFKIFKPNKRILLFLIEQKLFEFNESIAQLVKQKESSNFIIYFYPELKDFIQIQNKEIESFEEKRKEGENDDNEIFKLIRNDLIEEFIIYINKNNFSLSKPIEPSIFETHTSLLDKNITFAKYAAFFGSFQIFKYLYFNHFYQMNTNIWIYAIHGQNQEIFQFLIDKKITPQESGYENCVIESLKCHHVDVTNYLINNYVQFNIEKEEKIFLSILKYRNYSFFPDQLNDNIFFYLCKYCYFNLVDIILKKKDIDVNKIIATETIV